ncbi:complex component RRP40 [Seminavis robusta]|uniref:Complex component RRP40 n=1 Tax=Seminavis robusta TaxID=568900 RepID=A0A9N8EM11_9STRA|nr:complex component RRP40 [Seminavis robusta]|eukprot:Sro1229_g254490.1 complex component RRP40 (301) ;mRNA; f:27273-28175
MGKSKSNNKVGQSPSPTPPKDELPLVVVLPGDDVTDRILPPSSDSSTTTTTTTKKPKLGVGLSYNPTTHRIQATLAGKLRQHRNNKAFFVQQNTKRYVPALEDRVVVVVEDRIGSDGVGGDLYRVNMGGPHPALMSSLAFEGASKRNKPQFAPGTLLYARVATLYRNGMMDPVLSCQNGPHDLGIAPKDWMTNEGTYGELKGGTMARVSLGLARELLRPSTNVVLDELAQPQYKLAFELAVGVNGFVWVHSTRPEYTILIHNAIRNSEVLTPPQVRAMVQSLVFTVQKQIQQNADREEDV